MSVDITARFTKDEKLYNGLDAITDQLLKEPLSRPIVVAVVEVTNIDINVREGGVQTPKIRFAMIEALDGDSAIVAREMLDAAFNARTGKGAPPDTLFDAPRDADADPTAGPWPGDDDYPDGAEDGAEAADSPADDTEGQTRQGRKGRKTTES